jgi:ribosomal protein S27E
MHMLQARCPSCGKLLAFSESHAGKVVKCPSCGKVLRLPGPGAGGPTAPAGAKAQVSMPAPGPPSMPADVGPAQAAGDFKACKWCGEQIREGAIKCRFCGEMQEGSDPEAPGSIPVPWDQRSSIGVVSSFISTVRQACLEPDAFFRGLDPKGSAGSAFLFGCICAAIGAIIGATLNALIMTAMGGASHPRSFHLPGMTGVAAVIAAIVFVPIGTILRMLFIHLCVMIFGANRSGLTGTIRGIGYSQAPMLINAIPYVGGLVAWVWTIVLSVYALREVHGMTTGKAILIMLLPWLVCCCLVGAGVYWLLFLSGWSGKVTPFM